LRAVALKARKKMKPASGCDGAREKRRLWGEKLSLRRSGNKDCDAGTAAATGRCGWRQTGITPLRKLLLAGLGLCVLGALWKAEEEEDGAVVALSPFLAALALEAGIFLLRRHQGVLLGQGRPNP
jgi:hypothetical protein